MGDGGMGHSGRRGLGTPGRGEGHMGTLEVWGKGGVSEQPCMGYGAALGHPEVGDWSMDIPGRGMGHVGASRGSVDLGRL